MLVMLPESMDRSAPSHLYSPGRRGEWMKWRAVSGTTVDLIVDTLAHGAVGLGLEKEGIGDPMCGCRRREEEKRSEIRRQSK